MFVTILSSWDVNYEFNKKKLQWTSESEHYILASPPHGDLFAVHNRNESPDNKQIIFQLTLITHVLWCWWKMEKERKTRSIDK